MSKMGLKTMGSPYQFKKLLLPLCVLILILILCVYAPSSTRIIALTSPKAIPRPVVIGQSHHNAIVPGRASVIRSLDATKPPNDTTTTTTQLSRASINLEQKPDPFEASGSSSLQLSAEAIVNAEDARLQTTSKLKDNFFLTDSAKKPHKTENAVKQPSAQSKMTSTNSNSKSIKVTPSSNRNTPELLPETLDKCNPINKIIFIKTHKTGSTTTASIFERYGYRRNLMFALPKSKHVFSTTYFSKKGVIPIPKLLAKSHPHYDILDNHAVYNRMEMDKLVPNATYITIIRDPVTQLESAFGYFEMAKGMGLSKAKNPLDTFMQNPFYYYYNTSYTMKLRSRNGQLYDLGFQARVMNDTNAIQAKIDTLDIEFDLVLVTEYFDESLILLKKRLCWSFDDILYISNGIRSKSHRLILSDDLKRRIRKWNAGDVLLYNHFNQTLWQKIQDYGPSFWTDLETFRELEKEAVNKCVDFNKVNSKDRREDKFVISPKHSGKYCQDLMRGDVEYTALLKQRLTGTTNRAALERQRKRHNERMKINNQRIRHRGR